MGGRPHLILRPGHGARRRHSGKGLGEQKLLRLQPQLGFDVASLSVPDLLDLTAARVAIGVGERRGVAVRARGNGGRAELEHLAGR